MDLFMHCFGCLISSVVMLTSFYAFYAFFRGESTGRKRPQNCFIFLTSFLPRLTYHKRTHRTQRCGKGNLDAATRRRFETTTCRVVAASDLSSEAYGEGGRPKTQAKTLGCVRYPD